MAYQKRVVKRVKGRNMVVYQALGGASDCGAGQTWYPNLTYAGVTGQCATPALAQSILSSGQATGNLNTTADSSTGGLLAGAGQIAGGLLSNLFGPKPPTTPAVAPSSGMSPTTMVLIGGAGLLGLALILKSRS